MAAIIFTNESKTKGNPLKFTKIHFQSHKNSELFSAINKLSLTMTKTSSRIALEFYGQNGCIHENFVCLTSTNNQ